MKFNIKRAAESIENRMGRFPALFFLLFGVGVLIFFLSAVLTGGESLAAMLFSDREDTFMDFYNSIRYGTHPYEHGVIYPPLINCIFALFGSICSPEILEGPKKAIAVTQMGQFSLILFIILSLMLLLSAVKNSYSGDRLKRAAICFTALFCEPVLFSVERGNSIILCFAATAFFCFFYDSENKLMQHLAMLSLAAAVSIKIYVVIFGLLLIKDKKWRNAVICMIYGLLVFLVPFVFLDGGPFTFVKNILTDKGGIGGNGFRYNIKNFVAAIMRITGIPKSVGIVICMIFAAVVFLIFAISFISKGSPRWLFLLSVCLLFITLPTYSFVYSLMFLLIPLISLLKELGNKKKASPMELTALTGLLLLLMPMGIIEKTPLPSVWSVGTAVMNYDTVVKNIILYVMVFAISAMTVINYFKTEWQDMKRFLFENEKFKKFVYIAVSCCIALAAGVIIVFAFVGKTQHAELDSYALPVVSIQHRGSIVMTPDDIIQAKTDFPDLYENVNSYDDLRSSKLIKIDEGHWLSYYFPVYPVLCIPVKLILQLVGMPASRCFEVTNALLIAAALFFAWRYVSRRDKTHIMLPALLAISPFLLYVNFRSAEAAMGALMVIAMVCWREGRRRTAALIISITCTMQPVIMAVGIVIFIDYVIRAFKNDPRCYKNKATIKETLLLCCCYIPSLVPFVVNKVLLGKWSETAGIISGQYGEDTVFGRFLEYFFDINIGIGALSLPLAVLFIAACVYGIAKRNYTIVTECAAAVFLTFLISFAGNINCGMVSCARYVVWIYPVVVFAVHEFLVQVIGGKSIIEWAVSACCILYTMLMIVYNGFYPVFELNKLSANILDRFPQLYVTFCDSTFNAKVNGVHGGYDLMEQGGYAVYYDSDRGEVRKILYVNTEAVKTELMNRFTSEQDADMSGFAQRLKDTDDGRQYYISISRYEDVQYVEKEGEGSLYTEPVF